MGRTWRFLFAKKGESAWRLLGLGLRSLLAEGPRATWRRLRSYAATVTEAAAVPLPPRSTRKDVLFVAGCPGHPRRWRCEHALETVKLCSGDGDVVDHPAAPLPEYLDCYREFVLQRVPHDPEVERFVRGARAAGKRVVADVDDLVIHEKYGDELPVLRGYTPFAKELYVQQLRRIGQVLQLVAEARVPTDELAAELRTCWPHLSVEVVPNVASRAMVEASGEALAASLKAEALAAAARADGGAGSGAIDGPEPVVLGYFAGTRTHDADLATIVPALAEILDARPLVRLLLAGELDLPAALAPFAARIERRAPVPWRELPPLLRSAHVHLVPLAESKFTACKSELKWIEAALVGRPVIASFAGPYRRAVQDGLTGWLAESPAEWRSKLLRAIDEPTWREEVGTNARRHVFAHCTTDAAAAGTTAGQRAADCR